MHLALDKKHVEITNGGFYHIANVGQTEHRGSIAINDQLTIRQANESEIETIEMLISSFAPPLLMPVSNYTGEWTRTAKNRDSATSSWTRFPKDQLRYVVLAFTGFNQPAHDLQTASALTTSPLIGGAAFCRYSTFPGGILMPGDVGTIYNELKAPEALLSTFTEAAAAELKSVYDRYRADATVRTLVDPPLGTYIALRAIPTSSALRMIGYVSLVESLIAHKPHPQDSYDSVRRQFSTKLVLVGNRSKIQLPYTLVGAAPKNSKLWLHLYDYRSKIAHGGDTSIPKECRELKDLATATELARQLAVAVMRQLFEEPALMQDLKEC
jgi:hypothetical protein